MCVVKMGNNGMHQVLICKEKERGSLEQMMRPQIGVGSLSVSVMRPSWGKGIGFEFSSAHFKTPFVELSPTSVREPSRKPPNNVTHFNLLSDGHKIQGNGEGRAQAINTSSNDRGLHELEFGQAVAYGKYQLENQAFCEIVSPYGPPYLGRMMLPLDLTRDDGPIFVNSKQYHGILRRRQSRAKSNRIKSNLVKEKKPFMHLSRHLHAKRRPRGSGGRFLNTKKLNVNDGTINKKKKSIKKGKMEQPTGSQNSEVMQSDGTNIDSFEEINVISTMTYNRSASEVISIFPGQDCYDFFSMNHPWQSSQPMPDAVNSERANLVLASKWVAATDPLRCCNLEM